MDTSKPTNSRCWIRMILLLSSSLVFSCIDQLALPFREERPHLVVEGSITTELPPYIVRLTYSRPIGSSTAVADRDAVSNALVSIQDDTGRRTQLVPISQKPGYYQTTDSLFRGTVGRSYTLHIETQQHSHYQSTPERIVAVPPIDSLTAALQASLYGYNLSFSVVSKDPASTINYYRWTSRAYHVEYWVPCGASLIEPYVWVPVFSTGINSLSDTYLNGNALRREVIQSPIHSTGPHFVEVKQYAITQTFYQFLTAYTDQQSRTGSLFDPLPGRIAGNVICLDDSSQVVLGYFHASAVSLKQLRYYDTTNLVKPNVQSYLASFQPNCSIEGTFMLKYDPPGF